MKYNTVEHVVKGGIHTLVLSRPDRLNALTDELVAEALGILSAVERDPAARVLVIAGKGRGFCAGADIGLMDENIEKEADAAPWGSDQIRVKVRSQFQPLIRTVYEMAIPTIASVRGPAVGGGFDLACACDLAIASKTARFMVAYVHRGLFPDLGGYWLLPRLVGPRKAAELLFTGRSVEAVEAFDLGLVNSVVDDGDLEAATSELATTIEKGPPIALRLAKLLMQRTSAMDLRASLEMAAMGTTITETSDDFKSSIRAFLEGGTPEFTGQ